MQFCLFSNQKIFFGSKAIRFILCFEPLTMASSLHTEAIDYHIVAKFLFASIVWHLKFFF